MNEEQIGQRPPEEKLTSAQKAAITRKKNAAKKNAAPENPQVIIDVFDMVSKAAKAATQAADDATNAARAATSVESIKLAVSVEQLANDAMKAASDAMTAAGQNDVATVEKHCKVATDAADAAALMTDDITVSSTNKRFFKIFITPKNGKGETKMARVTGNGRRWNIPRGEDVIVEEIVMNILNDAVGFAVSQREDRFGVKELIETATYDEIVSVRGEVFPE